MSGYYREHLTQTMAFSQHLDPEHKLQNDTSLGVLFALSLGMYSLKAGEASLCSRRMTRSLFYLDKPLFGYFFFFTEAMQLPLG